MLFHTQSLLLAGVALAASTEAQKSTQQVCPSQSVSIFESCICPPGTQYQISSLYAMLGVNAKDFYKYTASFYDISWQGTTKFVATNGPDYTAGSIRTFYAPTSVGTFNITEQLDSFQTNPDGSYFARFSQFNSPIEYDANNGSFSGYWINFDAEYAAPYQTTLQWTVYACFTGHPFNFGPLHVKDLKGLLATMKSAGLVKGTTTGPFYVQDW